MSRLRRWLRPGTGISGWLVVVFLGELLLALAGALVIRQLFRDVPASSPAGQAFNLASLQFLPRLAATRGGAGGRHRASSCAASGGSWACCWSRSRRTPSRWWSWSTRSARWLAVGASWPSAVAPGQSTLLRGLKEATSNITAIVTVADDGGSSGKLREELGIAPVGDIRNCITALADAEPTMTRLLQYRFPTESPDAAGLSGHAFGNLLIAALSDIAGDFEEGVRLSNRVLAVRGQVVPVAPTPLTLHAELADGPSSTGSRRSCVPGVSGGSGSRPAKVEASVDAVEAIRSAELIVLGPGSLYTSLLPSLLVPGIRSALEATSGVRVFVCNVATQPGETEGYTLSEHLAALHAHEVGSLVDVVLANDNPRARQPADYPAAPVRLDMMPGRARRSWSRRTSWTSRTPTATTPRSSPWRCCGSSTSDRPSRCPWLSAAPEGLAVPVRFRSSTGTTRPRPRRGVAGGAGGHRADPRLLSCRDARRPGRRGPGPGSLGGRGAPGGPPGGRRLVPLRLAHGRRPLPHVLAARSLPGARLAEPRRRSHAPGVGGGAPRMRAELVDRVAAIGAPASLAYPPGPRRASPGRASRACSRCCAGWVRRRASWSWSRGW